MGVKVTSRWISLPPTDEKFEDIPFCTKLSIMNIDDLKEADILLLLTCPGSGTGHHFETGYAMALEKLVVLVGPKTSLFQVLADDIFPDWSAAKGRFEEWMPPKGKEPRS